MIKPFLTRTRWILAAVVIAAAGVWPAVAQNGRNPPATPPAQSTPAPQAKSSQVVKAPQPVQTAQKLLLTLPNKDGSVKVCVIGDSGSGEKGQFEIANVMTEYRKTFVFERVIMLGDNIYTSPFQTTQGPKDFKAKFELPYKALLDQNVKFYAALGNHDDQNNRNYPLFNMNGLRYYSHGLKNVRFFVLDSDKLDPDQLKWIEEELKNSKDEWKIVYFHHPLYSDGGAHGSSIELRVVLEPIFVKYGVNVVFQGHDHIYERVTTQKGIQYFVEGASGKIREGDTRKAPTAAAVYDEDRSFMLIEFIGPEMFFQTISRTGQVVDSGSIRAHAGPVPVATPTETSGKGGLSR